MHTYTHIHTPTDIHTPIHVKKDTEAAIDWFDENQMQANPVKFQFMHTSKNEDDEFECRNIKIESEESVKLLVKVYSTR